MVDICHDAIHGRSEGFKYLENLGKVEKQD